MLTQTMIDQALNGLFDDPIFAKEPAGLYDPLRYMIAIGGKRLRPRLCLTTYSLYKDELGDEILQPAAGLEIFHSFTLLHDDIMDKSTLRRGQETVWKKWNEDTAILSGDVMCIESFRRMAQAPAEVLGKALHLFTKTAAEVCEGQQFDMDFEKREEVSMAEYMDMVGLKTGVLIACSAEMGALIGGADKRECEALSNYGYHLGLAFQVADDYLDAYGDSGVFGKAIGGDIVNNKKCWLTTKALEKADENTKKELTDFLALPTESEEDRRQKIEKVMRLYQKLNVAEEAKEEIIMLSEKAIQYASAICSGDRLDILCKFAEKLIGRNS